LQIFFVVDLILMDNGVLAAPLPVWLPFMDYAQGVD
jgi:hypothetical protein